MSNGKKCRLTVESVENGLDQKKVHSASDEVFHLLAVGRRHLLKGNLAGAWIVDVAGNGQGLAHRANRPSNKDLALGESIGCLASQPRRL